MEAGIDRGAKGFCRESASNRSACADSLRNCENADLTEKKNKYNSQPLKSKERSKSRDRERITQWKAVCRHSARTV